MDTFMHGSSPTFLNDLHTCFFAFFHLAKDHSIQNQVPDHVIGLIHKCISIIMIILTQNTL